MLVQHFAVILAWHSSSTCVSHHVAKREPCSKSIDNRSTVVTFLCRFLGEFVCVDGEALEPSAIGQSLYQHLVQHVIHQALEESHLMLIMIADNHSNVLRKQLSGSGARLRTTGKRQTTTPAKLELSDNLNQRSLFAKAYPPIVKGVVGLSCGYMTTVPQGIPVWKFPGCLDDHICVSSAPARVAAGREHADAFGA